MHSKFLPKTDAAKLKALRERLYERLADINVLVTVNARHDDYEKGFNNAVRGEIKFLTDLLDALEKS